MKETNSQSNCGLLYVATGEKFRAEALVSIESVREHMPQIGICLYTDELPKGWPELGVEFKLLTDPVFRSRDKIEPLCNPPFERCVFIDTDTIVLEDFSEVFEACEHYDLGICHDVIRTSGPLSDFHSWFPELNTGFFVYRKSEKMARFFKEWYQYYDELGWHRDQPAFRKVLFESEVDLLILPNEYNLRPVHGWLAGGNARVKILHGRGLPLRKAIKRINRVTGRHRGDNLKPRIGRLNVVERFWWKLLKKLKLDSE